MTVGAHEIALIGLCHGSFDASEETAKCEVLRGRVSVVELQSRDGARVAAVQAASASGIDELGFDPDPLTSAVVDP